MRHQSIKLRGQTLVARTSTKEDLILQGDVMMNKMKSIERRRKEKQLVTMKIKKVEDKDLKKKKEKMKTKIIKNRLRAIRIGKTNKMNNQRT
jgi:protein involved in sex pheromone biosynthesis